MWVLAYGLFNSLMLVDLVMAVVFYGAVTLYKARREFLVEAVIQVAFFATMIYYFALDVNQVRHQMKLVRFMSILLICRLPIISVLLMELHDFKVIVETVKRMLSSFLSILFSFYLFLSIFAIIGRGLYGGIITLDNLEIIGNAGGNELYYQLNFNDSMSGMMTLFCILASNNWNSFVTIFAVVDGSNGPYYFLSIYFILSIMVMLNIVVSFIMEIYTVVLDDAKPKYDKLDNLKELQKLSKE